MAVFILGDSFTLEHKGKLGSEHYKKLMYNLHCNLLTLEEGSYNFCIRKLVFHITENYYYYILPPYNITSCYILSSCVCKPS